MTPEQATGAVVDARSDLYSLGVVAFLVLSGKLLFEGSRDAEWIAHHIGTRAPRLSTVAPGAPRKLAGIVDQCLAKDPMDRPQTSEALADALSTALSAKTELPIPVRIFVQEARSRQERSQDLLYVILAIWLGLPLTLSGFLPAQLLGVGMLGLLVGWPVSEIGTRVRRLLRSGYGREDLVHGFAQDLEARDEDLRFLFGEDYKAKGRKLRNLAFTSLGIAGALLVGAIAGR